MQSLDEFLRTSLKGYKVPPSDSERSRFLKEAGSVTGTMVSYRKWVYTGIIAALLMITGLVVYFTIPRYTSHPQMAPGKIHNANAAVKTVIPEQNIRVRSSSTVPLTKKVSVQRESAVPGQDQITSGVFQPGQTKRNHFLLTSLPLKTDIVLVIPDIIDPPSTVANSDISDLSPEPLLTDSLNPPSSSEPMTNIDPRSQAKGFTVGVYYEPEWMFNLLKEDKNMMVNNFGLKGEYWSGRWSLGTGLGLSITRGTNEIMVGYNDYLGRFRGLDSITFTWNSYHSHLIPTYYYSYKDYYDSLVKLDYYNYNRSYVYLQIPLVLGYDFIQLKGFNLGLRVGPTISMLINTTPQRDGYSHGHDRIIQVNDINPERIQTNYQLTAGIAAGVRVYRNLELEAEPVLSYYFNSVYEKGETARKPWSAGIKISVKTATILK